MGTIRSEGSGDRGDDSRLGDRINDANDAERYGTLQEALDAYDITEFREPTWIPDGYKFDDVEVDSWANSSSLIGLSAHYCSGADFIQIQLAYYEGRANVQMEKINTDVETFVVDGLTVYLFENINNNCAAWITEHYECYVNGPVEKQVLKQMVLSAYEHTT